MSKIRGEEREAQPQSSNLKIEMLKLYLYFTLYRNVSIYQSENVLLLKSCNVMHRFELREVHNPHPTICFIENRTILLTFGDISGAKCNFRG